MMAEQSNTYYATSRTHYIGIHEKCNGRKKETTV